MNDRIERAFAAGREEGRALFIVYLCAGDPDFPTSLEACRTVIEHGADLLELGVPFSDPLADGPTNQLAAQRALESGMTPAKVFDLVRAIREFSDIPIVLYTYYNLVFARGEETYAHDAAAAGVDGLLTLDLPPEEGASFSATCQRLNLRNIFIIAPTTPPERCGKLAQAASGFIYYVSRTGVTGVQASLDAGLEESVKALKGLSEVPVAVGFGISRPEHVEAVGRMADGVVVGSAIVNCVANNAGNAEAICSALRAKMLELRPGLNHDGR